MRKCLLAVLVVSVAGLVVAGPAAAAYYLPVYKAENLAKHYTKELCLGDAECVSWGVKCSAASRQVVFCNEATWDEASPAIAEPGEYLKCESVERFGVGYGGFITERFPGKPHCTWVYEP